MTTTFRIAPALVLAVSLAGCNWRSQPGRSYEYLLPQEQFFYRMRSPQLYVAEPAMFDKLDLDDDVMYRQYEQDPSKFQQKLAETHVDINTVLVKPDPAPIRFLAVQENSPEPLCRLFLLTGDDTAQLLEDGIHLRRHGFPEQVLGGPAGHENLMIHSEMGQQLWSRNPNFRSGWMVLSQGSGEVHAIGTKSITTEHKHKTVYLYHLDCDALHKFVQPLAPGESTRDTVLKVNVPSTPELPVCQIQLELEAANRWVGHRR